MYNQYGNQVLSAQNRLNQMESIYPQFQQQQPIQQNLLKGRFVSSLDEVKAAQVDFDGSIFFFPDLANNKIFTKQISLEGNALIRQYDVSVQNEKQKLKVETDVYDLIEDLQKQIDLLKGEQK